MQSALRMQRLLLAAIVLLGGVEAAHARTTFLTDEFVVNTHTTSYQWAPAVTGAEDGSFVVVWSSFGPEGGALTGAGVVARRYDADANGLDTEFVVNTYTTNSQYEVDVARRAPGELVVVWRSVLQDSEYSGVFGQWLDPLGIHHGPEFRVDPAPGTQSEPAVVVGTDGTALVVYGLQTPPVGGSREVFGRFVDANGSPQGDAFQVNTYTGSIQGNPDVCVRPDGRFVVVWESGFGFEHTATQDGSGTGVYGQILSSSGELVGTEFQVHVTTTYAQGRPSVVCTEGGEFLVVWGGFDPARPHAAEGVFARRFEASGAPAGSELLLNPRTESSPSFVDPPSPSIAAKRNGGFVVVWEDYGYGPGELGESRILARELSETGLPRGGEVAISTAIEGVGFEPRIAGNGDRFVVTWTNAPGFEQPAYASADRDWSGVIARTFAVFPDCGDADDTGALTASDALAALRTAIALFACDACICDVDGSGSTTSTDALTILQRAVGLPNDLTCADCG